VGVSRRCSNKEEFATKAEAVEREKYLKTGFGRALIKRRTGK
jgi:hypothetical protein